jgi:hypothetical protein
MRLRHLHRAALIVVLGCGGVSPAAAQGSEPYGGRVALSAAIGGAVPTGERLDNGMYAGATLLVSIASHVALTAEAGINRVAVDRPGFQSDFMPRFADLNLFVHWRRGPFRPFVSGGVGVYRYTVTVSSQAFVDPALRTELIALGLSPTSSRAPIETRHDERGLNLGGGFDYFFTRRSAVLMDARGHGSRDFLLVAPFQGLFVTAAVGFRQYF